MVKEETKRIIWDNTNIEESYSKEDYKEYLECNVTDQDGNEMLENRDDYINWAFSCSWQEHDDCEFALKGISAPYGILVVGSIGRWNGTSSGKSIIYGDASNCMNCFITEDCNFQTFYIDENYNLCFEGEHHDGHNECVFSIITDSELEDKLDYGTATEEDIKNGIKPMGHEVLRALGWE